MMMQSGVIGCRARLQHLAGLFLILLVTLQAIPGAADDVPVVLDADTLFHNQVTDIVTARGNVRLSQGKRVLYADRVAYDRTTDTVTATGNVRLEEPGGEIAESDYAVLKDELKTGFIKNLQLTMPDGSRLMAQHAERHADQRKTMQKATFTPCEPCSENPDKPPLWQIRASKVIHDEAAQDIEYRNAYLEMHGVPVLYTPYLKHPDPSVDRRTGFLFPYFAYSENLGFIYGQPFYYAMDRNRDFEIEPVIYSNAGQVARSRYRQAFRNGFLDLFATAGTFERPDGNDGDKNSEVHGSVDFSGKFVLNEAWRTGFDLARTSDRTYLRRYDLNYNDVLTSHAYLEHFDDRDHALLSVYDFQNLRSEDSGLGQPTVFPAASYSHIGNPDSLGGRFQFDVKLASLSRDIGTESNKLSLVSSWQLPYYAPRGDIYTLTAQLQSDFYSVRNPIDATDGPLSKETHRTARLFPQIGLNWRYPFVRYDGDRYQVIEPVVNIVAGPNGGNPAEIPDEDSQAFEYDDTNIFAANRFGGTDRVTSGTRIDYGISANLFDPDLGSSQAFFGQSYRIRGDSAFDRNSGLHDKISDYVGRVHYVPTDWLDILTRFRLDKDRFQPRRREFEVRFQRNKYKMHFDYVLLGERERTTSLGDREEISVNLTVPLANNWSMSGRTIHSDASGNKRTVNTTFGLKYKDECFEFDLELGRREFRDKDIEPDKRIGIRFLFRTLGEFSHDVIQ